MDKRIVEFIAALRASGVRISLAESKDAFEAVDELGVMEREQFKTGLQATLIKDAKNIPQFEELFPMFFQADQPSMNNPTKNLSKEDAEMLARALRQFTEHMRKMMQKLLEGRPLTAQEMEQLDRFINMDEVADLRYQNWKVRQMEQALQFKEVQKALEELMQLLQEMGMNREKLEQLRKNLQANQQALQDQLRQHVGQRILENLARQTHQERLDDLYNRPFHSLSEEDMRLLHREVKRLAAALRTRLALRLKRANSGQLDVKSTMRANQKYGSVPVEIRHRDHTLKPKIVVMCDISTSMRHVSELMLSLLYAIQDQISKTHAFSYIDHLEYVSPYFSGRQPGDAVTEILKKMPSGHYNTDLGYCLASFTKEYMDTIDYRSTFIVVGDARNNFNDPRLDVFRSLAQRSRVTIWLNPEGMHLWGTGDSDMLKYAPYCGKIFQVSNLAQMATAIDQLLLH